MTAQGNNATATPKGRTNYTRSPKSPQNAPNARRQSTGKPPTAASPSGKERLQLNGRAAFRRDRRGENIAAAPRFQRSRQDSIFALTRTTFMSGRMRTQSGGSWGSNLDVFTSGADDDNDGSGSQDSTIVPLPGGRDVNDRRRARMVSDRTRRLSGSPSLPNLSEQNLSKLDEQYNVGERPHLEKHGSGAWTPDHPSSRRRSSTVSATSTGMTSIHSQSTNRRLSSPFITPGFPRRLSGPRHSSRSSARDLDPSNMRGTVINTSGTGIRLSRKPIHVFRRVARLVRLLCSVCLAVRSYAIGKGLLDDYLVAVSHRRNKGEGEEPGIEELQFNLKDFKIKKELEVPRATQLLLDKRPEDRTDDDLVVIGRLMRGLPSFRKYTREMQQLFCKIVRYMKCQQNRVVLRKGHIGYNLYFIYTGACSVVLDKGDNNIFVKKEVIMLRKGACFGEIALVQNTRRTATVICSEDTEFLVVDKDLFLDNGLNHQMEQEFNFRYGIFRNLPMMTEWTDTQVKNLSNVSRTEEFGYNKIVVRDSRKNDWLWFVIKGSCDVIRLVDLEKCPSFKQIVLGSDVEARRSLEHLAAVTKNALLKPNNGGKVEQNGGGYSSAWGTQQRSSANNKENAHLNKGTAGEESPEQKADGVGLSGSKLSNNLEVEDLLNVKMPDKVENVLKVLDSKPNNMKMDPEPILDDIREELSEAGFGLFFKVDTLRDGQCFGLDTILIDVDDPPPLREFVLISRGCELIHVPKTRFLEIAHQESLIESVRECRDYPSDDTLCERFISRCKWDSYKREVVQEVIVEKNRQGFEAGLRSNPIETEQEYQLERDAAGASELRSGFANRAMSATTHRSSARSQPVRPHTSFGLQHQCAAKKGMRESWELDLDMMESSALKSRDSLRQQRPRTCPPTSSQRHQETSHSRGQHRSNLINNTVRHKNIRQNVTLTSSGYQVDSTNVYVKAYKDSQRTLQIVSNLRSRSHEDRLHKIRNK